MQCTAKSKRTHEQCRDRAMKGREVCYHHGGRTPIGPGSPHFRNGRYSKFLPSRMAADYNAAMHDPELVSLRKEIATVDARIIDVLKRVDSGEAGVIWKQAQAGITKFEQAKARRDADAMAETLEEVFKLITQGASDWAAWKVVITDLIDSKRKLVDSEQRRLTLAHEVLNAEQAMALLATVVKILQTHISDRTILGKIAADIQATVLMRQRGSTFELARNTDDAAD